MPQQYDMCNLLISSFRHCLPLRKFCPKPVVGNVRLCKNRHDNP